MKNYVMCVIAAVALVCGCSTEGGLQRMLGTGESPLIFYGCKTPAEAQVDFFFSQGVTVLSVYFDPPMETRVISEGETVAVRFGTEQARAPLAGGSLVSADILVEDKNRNTLNVLVSFRTRNERMPQLVINEIRTAYSKPRVEFIELKALTAGNLGAVRLFAFYEQNEFVFEFPPVDVARGEYIVVHTRSIEADITDETGASLAASGGTDALKTARDFWIAGALKLHDTNVIYLMDQDDKIMDGILLVSEKYKWKDSMTGPAGEMARQGAWSGAAVEDAFVSNGNTATRTINRAEYAKNTHSAADWYITVTSGATPGKSNNPAHYVNK